VLLESGVLTQHQFAILKDTVASASAMAAVSHA
jgi:hypothetical protein